MKLAGRNLVSDIRGADVAALHRELKQLGVDIPDDELRPKLFGRATLLAVQEFQRQHGLEPNGIVDSRTVDAINAEVDAARTRVVRGRVADGDGTPVPNVVVMAFDRDLRSEEALGQAVTGVDGHYEIAYTARQFRRAEKRTADLIVRLFGRDRGAPLLSSETIFNSDAVENVDFVVDGAEGRLSEYEQHLGELRPLLEDTPVATLTKEDVEFLTGESGIDPLHLAYLATAHQMAASSKVEPEVFYGLFRQELPTTLTALLLLPPGTWREALEASIEQNIVPSRFRAEIERIVSALRGESTNRLLRSPDGATSIPRVLKVAGLSETEQETFLTSYLGHTGDDEEFWTALKSTPLGARAQPLKATLQLGALTQNNAALLETLQSRNVRSIRDLPRLGREELLKAVLASKDAVAAIPANGADESDEQKATRYVDGLFDVLNVAAPTAFVQASYERSAAPARREVARVLANAPELELRDADVEAFFAERPQAMGETPDAQAVRMELKRVQRALRIAPNAAHAEALLDEGLDSAQAVTSLSPAAFLEQFAATFGDSQQAMAYYQRASQISDSATALLAAVKQSFYDIRPAVVAPIPDSVKALPNFSTLFGSQRFCSCDHCGSVLSPAAYLVDLLQFINPKAGTKPITKLRQKRPDIEHILLTCENTNTTLPYIDLVNEVLEFYVANEEITSEAAHNTAGMTGEELSINPQYVLDAAYEKLIAAVHSPALPFNRSLAVIRLYLEHLGTSRHELMSVFAKPGAPSSQDAELESLKVSPRERDILTGTAGLTPGELLGFTPQDPPGLLLSLKVGEVLQRYDISYDELIRFLATHVLNPGAGIKVKDDQNPPRCDPMKMSLENVTGAFHERFARFSRLWRKTRWSIEELDLAVSTLQGDDISAAFVQKLAVVQQIKTHLKLPLNAILGFWGDIQTQGPKPLYQQLFQNRAVLNPPDPGLALGAVQNSPALISDHTPSILAALRIRADDLNALLAHLGIGDEAVLSLGALSALHRHAALARALKLKLKELIALLKLSGIDPFQPSNPASTLPLIDLAKLVKDSGLSISQLAYLYLPSEADAAPPAAESSALLKNIHRGLRQIAADLTQTQVDSALHPLEQPLSSILKSEDIRPALEIIERASQLTAAEQLEFVATRYANILDIAEAQSILLQEPNTPQQRYEFLLQRLLAYQQRGFVIQTLSDGVKLESAILIPLVEEILGSDADTTRKALHDFLVIGSLPDDVMTADAADDTLEADPTMQSARRSYIRLHKAGLLLDALRINAKELRYVHQNSDDFGGVDLNDLSADGADFDPSHFAHWQRLARFSALSRSLPQRDADLIDVFEMSRALPETEARQAAVELLKTASGWDPVEVECLVGPNGLDLGTADNFENETKLLLLQRCIRLSGRLDISCEQLFRWAGGEPDAALANEIVNTANAKYSPEEWASIARPLNDQLREWQKGALVAYVLRMKDVVDEGITDRNRLFDYFLIDVEMTACMKTSRIKQAISSVQLFVQRCLMNLEEGVKPSSIDGDQWEWMKNYRIWEANRKVFLYPENWIEPELRDNKSAFFQELENELLQNELTTENAEQAFVHYLEKLDRVGRLEICGLYVQEPEDIGDEEIVHVFGRTTATPNVYYYRRLLNGRTWTAWEQVPLDVQGEHLLPIVHDRRLYLFWLHFEEEQDEKQELPFAFIQSVEHWRWVNHDYPKWKTSHDVWIREHALREVWKATESGLRAANEDQDFRDEVLGKFKEEYDGFDPLTEEAEEPREPSEPEFSAPPTLTHWQIKLGWGEYRNGRWSSKQLSSVSVVSPQVYRTLPALFIDRVGLLLGAGLFGEMNDAFHVLPEKDDGTVDETVFAAFLPPAESHFVRTSVKGGNLKFTIYRRYEREQDLLGITSLTVDGLEKIGSFSVECGSKITAVSTLQEKGYDDLNRPSGTTNVSMFFEHRSGSDRLRFKEDGKTYDVLKTVPDDGFYSLPYEHAQPDFRLKPPFQDFFFQDRAKTYYARYQDQTTAKLVSPSMAILGASQVKNSSLVEALNTGSSMSTKRLSHNGGKTIVKAPKEELGATVPTTTMTKSVGSEASRAFGRGGVTMASGAAKQSVAGAMTSTFNAALMQQEGLRFHTFFHPHICSFTTRLHRNGVSGLLSRGTQKLDADKPKASLSMSTDPKLIFESRYEPSSLVVKPYPREHVDFGDGAYSLYNWELFFHLPMLMAVSLTKNQRFADALEWFHFIFNPTTSDTKKDAQRYWVTLPFFENSDPEKDQITELLLALAEKKGAWKQVETQIEEWLDSPFNPHLIARLRLTAYQKNVVMKYIDNLIAWGDQLFNRDTLESINEATLLYILAYNILGPRQMSIPTTKSEPKSYSMLEGELDAFGNALVDVENLVPYKSTSWSLSKMTLKQGMPAAKSAKASSLAAAGVSKGPAYKPVKPGALGKSAVHSLYFCIPRNEEFLKYWDRVDDRLFKIRHCMNLEGVVRELPLFEPPIDPALLVRAAAAGVDLGGVLNDLNAPPPRYRFNVMLQKALEMCSELKSLSGALLAALEKRDGEAISNLRASQETALLRLVKDIKRLQIDETKANIEALKKTREVTDQRRLYYELLLQKSLIAEEQTHLDMLAEANETHLEALNVNLTAQALSLIPENSIGTSGAAASPVAILQFGGRALSTAVGFFGQFIEGQATDDAYQANRSSIQAGHKRRAEEWTQQFTSTRKELIQIDKQMIGAEIRQAISEKELENHEKQIENSTSVEELLRTKYTSEMLYGWMVGQVSKVYFQAYKLAFDLAKRAERAYRYELGLKESSFIQFGYWDNLRKGLMAGEQLGLDLKRLESAYFEQNRREHEITRNVSLVLHDPLSLMKLKETGQCTLSLPESLFDADYPGHYMRRIRNVSITIPSVVGPYTSINCTLTLLSNKTRVTRDAGEQYVENIETADDRFFSNFAAVQSVATSHAQSDSGMFELNFRDERYLPFEGAGAISLWRIELPKENNAFDFNTVSDVVLQLRYTSRDGGTPLKTAAQQAQSDAVANATASVTVADSTAAAAAPPLQRLFSFKTEFPNEWHRFLRAADPKPEEGYLHRFSADLDLERFPYFFRGRLIEPSSMKLFLKLKEGVAYAEPLLFRDLVKDLLSGEGEPLSALPSSQETNQFRPQGSPVTGLPFADIATNAVPLRLRIEVQEIDLPVVTAEGNSWWEIVTIQNVEHRRIRASAVDDMWLLCQYGVS